MDQLIELCKNSRLAAQKLALMGTKAKNDLLLLMASALEQNYKQIIIANSEDIERAKRKGMTDAMLDRLRLNEQRIFAMASGIKKVAALLDPVGEIISGTTRDNGLLIYKKRVPVGVIGIIYEARPNVTSDAASLCMKSGNAVVLRGGSEAIFSNKAVVAALMSAGLPKGSITLIEDTSRETAAAMMRLSGYIDVLIPRGGAGLIKSVVENASIPVIETGAGNCHVYVDESADLEMAVKIIENGKMSRPSVCNSTETLLVNEVVSEELLKKLFAKLGRNCEYRGCERAMMFPGVVRASETDWYTEYNDYILAIKVVNNVGEAIRHINKYGTKHSEVIVTSDLSSARKFCDEVDAAAVYVNASSRFTDGEEFGLGAEIGISTSKLHARGPMGLEALTSYKFIIEGDGQVR